MSALERLLGQIEDELITDATSHVTGGMYGELSEQTVMQVEDEVVAAMAESKAGRLIRAIRTGEEHRPVRHRNGNYWLIGCTCGWLSGGGWRAAKEHADHRTEAIERVLAGSL